MKGSVKHSFSSLAVHSSLILLLMCCCTPAVISMSMSDVSRPGHDGRDTTVALVAEALGLDSPEGGCAFAQMLNGDLARACCAEHLLSRHSWRTRWDERWTI